MIDEDFDPDEAPAPPKSTRKTTKKKDALSETDPATSTFTVTLKGASGYDAPWNVIRASTLDELEDILDDPRLAVVNGKIWNTAVEFHGGAPDKPAATASAGPRTSQPSGESRSCRHGSMQYKEGISKSGKNQGKKWRGFFCPTPQGTADQCDAEFLRD